jgi:hypothetical protein
MSCNEPTCIPPQPIDLTPSIVQSASGPRSASGDSGSMSEHSLPDQIAAARFLATAQALKARPLGLRYHRVRAPAASDVYRGPGGDNL